VQKERNERKKLREQGKCVKGNGREPVEMKNSFSRRRRIPEGCGTLYLIM
jgi:hypothetical protein